MLPEGNVLHMLLYRKFHGKITTRKSHKHVICLYVGVLSIFPFNTNPLPQCEIELASHINRHYIKRRKTLQHPLTPCPREISLDKFNMPTMKAARMFSPDFKITALQAFLQYLTETQPIPGCVNNKLLLSTFYFMQT